MQSLRDNVYGGGYGVSIEYDGPNGIKSYKELRSLSAAFRWPMRSVDGSINVREGAPFITRQKVAYDVGNFLLVGDQEENGFWFSFENAPIPDDIVVRRWPREMQGTTGTLENGEQLSYVVEKENRYYVPSLESQYIYSIYAEWGKYYGEFAFLASSDENDRQWWVLQQSS